MKSEQNCLIRKHELTAPDTWTLLLKAERDMACRPGQFLNIAVPGFPLRRPLSVTDTQDGLIRLTYQTVGEGTRALARYTGNLLSVLGPLGNGFSLPEPGKDLLLIGGGIGTAPLLGLAKAALRQGCHVTAVFGFRSPERTLFQNELAALDVKTHFCYDSQGENVVSAVLKEDLTRLPFAACGPFAMMRALDKVMQGPGAFSLECRMGCGFGACMGCSVLMRSGLKQICKDGPVFDRKEVLWENLR